MSIWLKRQLTPSKYFYEMCDTLKRCLLFEGGGIFAVFLWCVVPVLPVVAFGWYLAEVTTSKK